MVCEVLAVGHPTWRPPPMQLNNVVATTQLAHGSICCCQAGLEPCMAHALAAGAGVPRLRKVSRGRRERAGDGGSAA